MNVRTLKGFISRWNNKYLLFSNKMGLFKLDQHPNKFFYEIKTYISSWTGNQLVHNFLMNWQLIYWYVIALQYLSFQASYVIHVIKRVPVHFTKQ